MHGHWLGHLTNGKPGTVVVELDDFGDHYQGNVQVHYRPGCSPLSHRGLFGYIKTINKDHSSEIDVSLISANSSDEIFRFPSENNYGPPSSLRYNFYNNRITLSCNSLGSPIFECQLFNSYKATSFLSKNMSWVEFKSHINTNYSSQSENYIWRGQEQPWPLQSSFHRTRRADLSRFLESDLQKLRRYISVQVNYNFDFLNTNGDDLISFLALIQHHGYPTPLLDWTYSPYIAAFFAFHNIKTLNADEQQNARIFVFNQHEWSKIPQEGFQLAYGPPQFTIFESLATHNPRLIPQQGLSAFANIGSIESYIEEKQNLHNNIFLEIIDIPWAERGAILRELRFMGITFGSLFPGLDGTCKEMKERFFPLG